MYRVLDLFCGCGGLSEGFKLAGYQIVGGVDFNQPAIDTYSLNFQDSIGYCGDLSKMDESKIQEIFGDISNIDVIIGGPPCQGFSAANRWQKEMDDPRNRLFFEFVKFVDMAQPKAVVIENVQGIITRNNGYAKKRIYEIFEKRGYTVTHCILNAADYGVPQYRKRNFFVMLKSDTKFDFSKLKKVEHTVTVDEAIGELYGYEEHSSNEAIVLRQPPQTMYQRYLRTNDNKVMNHEVRYPAEIVQKRISYVPRGGNWKDVPEELWPSNRKNRHSSAYKRLDPADRSCTIDTGNAHSNYFHPFCNRIPTPREAARLQSFPDDFIFNGTRGNNYRQIGNAVPPLLAKAVADVLKVNLDKIAKDNNL